MTLSDEIENFATNFRNIFLKGIPLLLNDAGAYLSFGCTCSGIEALAGYCYPDEKENGEKFKKFLRDYMSTTYHPYAGHLWSLRNSLIHGFSPKGFALCHSQPNCHMTDGPQSVKVLNAESFFADFCAAAEAFLTKLPSDSILQANFEKHIKNAVKGGGLYIG